VGFGRGGRGIRPAASPVAFCAFEDLDIVENENGLPRAGLWQFAFTDGQNVV